MTKQPPRGVDLELVEPGVVDVARWPAEETAVVTGGLAAVAVVPVDPEAPAVPVDRAS